MPIEQLKDTPTDQAELSEWLLGLYDRYRWWFLGAMALIYLMAFNGQWRLEPDSALYLTIGRNLAEGQGYTYHEQINQVAYPGLPYLWAIVFKLFGTNRLWPAQCVMLLIGFVSLGLWYRLVRIHAGRAMAVLMTCMVGMTETVFRYAFELRNDLPFLMGILAFLVGYEGLRRQADPVDRLSRRAWPVWVNLIVLVSGLAVAVVMRPAMWALLGAVVLTAIWAVSRQRQGRWGRLVILLLAIGIVVAFYRFDPRRHSGSGAMGAYEESLVESATDRLMPTLQLAVQENLPKFFSSLVTDAAFGTSLGANWLNVIVALVVLGSGVALMRRRPLWGLLVAFTVAMIVVVPRPQARYLLAVLPLLAYGWWRMMVKVERKLPRPWGRLAFGVLLALWVLPNLGKVFEMVYEQRRMPFLAHYKNGQFLHVGELADAVRNDVPDPVPVVAPMRMGRILTYLSHRRIVEAREFSFYEAWPAQFFVILPPAADEMDLPQLIEKHGITLSPSLSTVKQGKNRADWTLHSATAARGPSTRDAGP